MLTPTNHTNIVKNFYSTILTQSELAEGRVLNKETANGADLIKILNSTDVTSFRLEDSFITFDVEVTSSEAFYISEERDNTMSTIVPYKVNMQVYGNGSYQMAQKLLARFNSDEVKTDFYDKGIWITNLVYVGNVKEFVNNTLWPRNDISIEATVRFNFNKYGNSGLLDADSLNTITITEF